jgi:hypothetical protein
MKYFSVLLIFLSIMNAKTIYDFDKDSTLREWEVEDDVVMGGRSSGQFSINEDGHAVFEGYVSLENNGGFSSVQYKFAKMDVSRFSKLVVSLKGDGKDYQFRVKSALKDYYSYVYNFSTSGEWQKIEINFEDMYPSFRGRKLNMTNYEGKELQEVRILIGNKKNEKFKLLIDKIEVK